MNQQTLMVNFRSYQEKGYISRHLDNGLREKAMNHEFPLRNSGNLHFDLVNKTVRFHNEPDIEFVSFEYLDNNMIKIGTEYSDFIYSVV